MARTTSKGLYVWDLSTDQFDHTQLASNWDTINSLFVTGAQNVETLGTVPTTNLFAGRTVMLSGADSGFQAWTMIRYDGSSWRPVGSVEVQPTAPTSGNFAGRVVILSSASGNFPAWSIIRYDGTAWDVVGGWNAVNNGASANNIKGLQQAFDAYISDATRGFVLVDRTSGNKYRLFINNGSLGLEVVT